MGRLTIILCQCYRAFNASKSLLGPMVGTHALYALKITGTHACMYTHTDTHTHTHIHVRCTHTQTYSDTEYIVHVHAVYLCRLIVLMLWLSLSLSHTHTLTHTHTTQVARANFNEDPYVRDFGLSVDPKMVTVTGRILPPPLLQYGGKVRVRAPNCLLCCVVLMFSNEVTSF